MRRRSNTKRCVLRFTPRLAPFLVLSALLAFDCLPRRAYAQDRIWSFTASAGYAFLSLDEVDDDNSADVQGYNRMGVPVSAFESVKRSPFFAARARYRLSREFAFSLTGFYNTKKVSTSYSSPAAALSLTRSVGSTDISLGIDYIPPSQLYFLEWYVRLDATLVLARAAAEARGTQTVKVDGVPTIVLTDETRATYKKSKLGVGVCIGADVPLSRSVFLHIEGGYRLARVGALDGDITQLGEQFTEKSTIEFNYSGFLLSAGVGFTL